LANEIRVNKAVATAAYLQATTPVDKINVEKAHVSAAYMASPVFSIVGDELRVTNPMQGVWPVTVRVTDAAAETYDEVFNITITD